MAEYHDFEISDGKAQMLASDLEKFSLETINKAWKSYRTSSQGSKMPTVGVLLQFIEDGNPPVQVAWNMIPRDEESSVVWSDEMRLGWHHAASLIREGNISSAFFAFKEAYEKAVLESRMAGVKPKWTASFGFDKSKREAAIIEALDKKRISLDFALKTYPELEYSTAYDRLSIEHKGSRIKLVDFDNNNILKQLNIPEKSF